MRPAALTAFLFPALLATAHPARAGSASASAPDSLALNYTAVPYFFRTPETGWGGGAAGGVFKRLSPGARPSDLMLQAQYTQMRQYQIGIKADHYTRGNRMNGSISVSFQEFPDRFFGIGGDTPDSLEERFTAGALAAEGQGMVAVAGPLKAGFLGAIKAHRMIETEAGGSLARKAVPGAGSWIATGFGPQIAWDSRDGVFLPTSGSWTELFLRAFPGWAGNDHAFLHMRLNARLYRGLGHGQVLALQGGFDFLGGEVPYSDLARLGGANLLRGYYSGRYRDKAMGLAQAEYRFPIRGKVTGAAFASGGKVAPDPAGLAEADLRAACGAGLRYRLTRDGVNLRLDVAVNREAETSVYLTFLEAF